MTRDNWILHMGGHAFMALEPQQRDVIKKQHVTDKCKECKSRHKTIQATKKRKEKDWAMESMGLTKVKSVSGKIYWE